MWELVITGARMSNDFAIHTFPWEGGCLVEVDGDLDLATSGRLADALARIPAGGTVVVGLEKCDFVDSTGLQVLAQAHRRLNGADGRFRVVTSNEHLLRLFRLVEFDDLLSIHRSRETALSSGNGRADTG